MMPKVIALQVKNAMFEYGRHLGLAFQIVDDILDFTTATEQLGKPQVDLCFQPASCLVLNLISCLDLYGSTSILSQYLL